ncbi:MAG TPA: cyclic nucleotide-binding domain-containing protein [Gaiellales bacterium]|nr:cyclic nucleotide-binding domain-containing protein [Gaiellales bacterium]
MSARLPVAKMFRGSAPADGGRMGREWIDVLADVPLFQGLTRRHLAKVAALARTKRFVPKTTLFAAGSPADAFYVILDGRASVRAGGRRIRLEAGDFFGEMALLDGDVRSAAVIAESDLLVMMIPRRGFLKLLENEPKIAIAIMATLAQRVRTVQAAANI